MKTRTLMLLALGCGLAIMLAGAVFLFQLTTQDAVSEPASIGDPVQIGDMRVVVDGVTERDGVLSVGISIGGTADDDPTDEFGLIASGRAVELASTTCPSASAALADCSIEFDVSGADGRSRVLFYERGEDRARWVLDTP